jgi:hypothetical protein
MQLDQLKRRDFIAIISGAAAAQEGGGLVQVGSPGSDQRQFPAGLRAPHPLEKIPARP